MASAWSSPSCPRRVAASRADADRPFAQIDDNAALALGHGIHDGVQALARAENIRHDIF
jgi:hypothetical protein